MKLAFDYEEPNLQATGHSKFLNDLENTFKRFFWKIVLPSFIFKLTGIQKQIDDHLNFMFTLIDEVISRKQASHEQKQNSGTLLEALIHERETDHGIEKLSRRELMDESHSIMIAGHETTANTLSWMMWYLVKDPEIFKKVQTEVREVLNGKNQVSYDDADRLVYCEAVFMEALRLKPTIPFFPRYCPNGAQVGGYQIPANTVVHLVEIQLGVDKDLWENPEVFNPDRFLVKENHRVKLFFPFGGGHRMCPGKRIAHLEAVTILAKLANAFNFTEEPSFNVEDWHMVTLSPSHGVEVRVSKV